MMEENDKKQLINYINIGDGGEQDGVRKTWKFEY
jgi:hypothetical protein